MDQSDLALVPSGNWNLLQAAKIRPRLGNVTARPCGAQTGHAGVMKVIVRLVCYGRYTCLGLQTRITRQRRPALYWGGPAFRFRPRDLLYWFSSVPPSKCLEFGNAVSFHILSRLLFINNHNNRRYIVGDTIDNVVN
jgi:hypothetical protein